MTQYFKIHPQNPQRHLIKQAVKIIKQGGVISLPTDSSYAIACLIEYKQSLDKIRRIRRLSDKHNFTLICKDLKHISNFAKLDNDAYRLIKKLTPGAFTFILNATKEVPRRLQHPNKKTIGIRVSDNIVTRLIMEELDEPLCSSTLILPDKHEAETDPEEIKNKLSHEIELIIDFGIIEFLETTVISCVDNNIKILRQGIGIATMLE